MTDTGTRIVNDLTNNFDDQAALYDKLLFLSEKKKNILIRNDVDGLRQVTEEETSVLNKIKRGKNTGGGLSSVIEKIKGINEQNRILIQNSLDYIEFSINTVKNALSGEPPFYLSYKDEYPIQTRGFFDMKG